MTTFDNCKSCGILQEVYLDYPCYECGAGMNQKERTSLAPGEGTWSTFAGKVVEERDQALEKIDELQEMLVEALKRAENNEKDNAVLADISELLCGYREANHEVLLAAAQSFNELQEKVEELEGDTDAASRSIINQIGILWQEKQQANQRVTELEIRLEECEGQLAAEKKKFEEWDNEERTELHDYIEQYKKSLERIKHLETHNERLLTVIDEHNEDIAKYLKEIRELTGTPEEKLGKGVYYSHQQYHEILKERNDALDEIERLKTDKSAPPFLFW